MSIDLRQFQDENQTRAIASFPEQCMTIEFLSIAIAGETGEMCNVVKKILRGDFVREDVKNELAKEIADIITYCDLMMSVLERSTEDELINKWNEVCKRRNYPTWFEIINERRKEIEND